MLVTMVSLMGEIIKEYRWVHGAAFGPARGGDKLEGGKHVGDPSDPTGGAVASVDREKARRALVSCTDTLTQAISELRSARYTLRHAHPDREPMPGQMGRAMVTRMEYAESQAAKGRREGRGEGWGEG